MNEIVYLNGDLIPRRRANLPVMDYGFLYGYGLFETMRAYGGRIFRLESHIDRLENSAKKLGIPVETAKLKDAVTETIKANNLSDARVRITVSIGEGGMTPDPANCGEPTVLITAGKYIPYPETVYEEGFSSVFSSVRRNSRSPLSGLKSTNYLESLLARQEARAAGADEALCLNEKGLLAEASMSNIFLVKNGVLQTPGEDSGILPGITRGVVLEIASSLGISASEQDIEPEEIFKSDEAFLTNSLTEIIPLTEVDGRPVASGEPGAVTRQLRTEYRKLVLEFMTSGQ